MPDHEVYVEPFFGSGALFFAKGYKEVSNSHYYREVIGDLDFNVYNFYKQLFENYELMLKKLEFLPYHEYFYKKSFTTSEYYKNSDDLTKACLFFFNILCSFGGNLNHGFAYGRKSRNNAITFINKQQLLKHYAKRIKQAFIFNKSYEVLIDRFDSEKTLFYFDPPYKDTAKYNIQKEIDFSYEDFVKNIKNIKGKFIFSHYKDEWLLENFKEYKIVDLKHYCSIQKSNGEKRKGAEVKECIVLNYNPDEVELWDGKQKNSRTGKRVKQEVKDGLF